MVLFVIVTNKINTVKSHSKSEQLSDTVKSKHKYRRYNITSKCSGLKHSKSQNQCHSNENKLKEIKDESISHIDKVIT